MVASSGEFDLIKNISDSLTIIRMCIIFFVFCLVCVFIYRFLRIFF